MSISVSGCVCLGHVKWRWCFGDKNTVLQGETNTQFGNGSAGAGDGDAAGAFAGALAGAGAGVDHANIVVKFVLVPVGVVCACAGAPDEVAGRRGSQQGFRALKRSFAELDSHSRCRRRVWNVVALRSGPGGARFVVECGGSWSDFGVVWLPCFLKTKGNLSTSRCQYYQLSSRLFDIDVISWASA